MWGNTLELLISVEQHLNWINKCQILKILQMLLAGSLKGVIKVLKRPQICVCCPKLLDPFLILMDLEREPLQKWAEFLILDSEITQEQESKLILGDCVRGRGSLNQCVFYQQVEKELKNICNEILEALERHLLPSAKIGESKVFYNKM